MKCDECKTLIDDYAYGELDEKASAKVAAHLSGCAGCSAIYAQLESELEIYMRYEREVEVTPALWAAVEARIKEEKAAPNKSWLALVGERFKELFHAPRLSPAFAAAMVVIAIGATVLVTTLVNKPNGNQNGGQVASQNANTSEQPTIAQGNRNVNAAPPQTAEPESTEQVDKDEPKNTDNRTDVEKEKAAPLQKQQFARATPPSADQLVREAEQKYLAAISLLERDVKKSKLDPSVRARFDVALADIDRTIQETRQVARKNPNDAVAAQYLLGAYSKKVDVLREMSRESAVDDQ